MRRQQCAMNNPCPTGLTLTSVLQSHGPGSVFSWPFWQSHGALTAYLTGQPPSLPLDSIKRTNKWESLPSSCLLVLVPKVIKNINRWRERVRQRRREVLGWGVGRQEKSTNETHLFSPDLKEHLLTLSRHMGERGLRNMPHSSWAHWLWLRTHDSQKG